MKLLSHLIPVITLVIAAAHVLGRARAIDAYHESTNKSNVDLLQDIITWDERSLFIRGERVTLWSGEFHPFRLPNPALYLDVFQKIKALGFNAVSFYVFWSLLEAKQGDFRADGIFDLEPFFVAAKDAGLFLIARPGPYVNAETSGGGYPGWLQSIPGVIRTNDTSYLDSTDNYMSHICALIAKHQITNGGPVILFQPENEFYAAVPGFPFPNPEYFQYVIDQARKAGIVVPLMNNDALAAGNQAPGTGKGSVDIYGYDAYPVGFSCANPTLWPPGDYVWPFGGLPTYWHAQHEDMSPKTPLSLPEFQGGVIDQFAGYGYDNCAALTNQEFERLFYKNNWASGVAILNLYMIFGGTNWGHMASPGLYSSYDYGSAIKEDRTITREKYAELKLEAQFIKVSPQYLLTAIGNYTERVYSNTNDLAITPLLGNGNKTGSFFVTRHANYTSWNSTQYTLTLPTSAGQLSIPRLGGSLSLHGRDSKIHVTDYPVGNYTLLYSTAEVFTWKKFFNQTIVILYGGSDELHEIAVKGQGTLITREGNQTISGRGLHGGMTFQWNTSPVRQVVQYDDLFIYLLDRNSAYNYWVPLLPDDSNPSGSQYGSSVMNPDAVIVNGGHLVRSVTVAGQALYLSADFNQSTSLEVIGAPRNVSQLVLNGKKVEYKISSLGNWITTPRVTIPKIKVPKLSSLRWYYLDGLPEIQKNFDDSRWPAADLEHTHNTANPLRTPTSLYGGDYGFYYGTLVYRGHFSANGTETRLKLWTQGGSAFANSVWLDDTFIGSYAGNGTNFNYNNTYSMPKLIRGTRHSLTVLVDTAGLEENGVSGSEQMKSPRGILDYTLESQSGHATPISWKLTGNIGGEDYLDKSRGPMNEGGLFHERQGYHLPGAPHDAFSSRSPFTRMRQPGVAFYATNLSLDLPADNYDIPLSFMFQNTTETRPYRAFLYVNGFMVGRYVQNIGPQYQFPVQEGIINPRGDNWIGIAVWALDNSGVRLPGLTLEAGPAVLTARPPIEIVKASRYHKRRSAY